MKVNDRQFTESLLILHGPLRKKNEEKQLTVAVLEVFLQQRGLPEPS